MHTLGPGGTERFRERLRATLRAGWLIPLLCLTVTLAAMFLYPQVWDCAPYLRPDSHEYLQTARHILAWPWSSPPTRTPGYPLLLILSGQTTPTRTLVVLQLLLHFSATWLLADLLQKLGVRPALIVLFCLLMALPPYVQSAAHVLTEVSAEFTVAVGFVLTLRYLISGSTSSLISAALVWSYSGLIRPANALVPSFAILLALGVERALWGISSSRPARRRLLALTGAVAPVCALLLYSAVNWVCCGYFGPTPRTAYHLSTRVVESFDHIPDPVFRSILTATRNRLYAGDADRSLHERYWAASFAEGRILQATGLTPLEFSRRLQAISLELIVHHPLQYLRAVADAAFTIVLPYRAPHNSYGHLDRFAPLIWFVPHLALMAGLAVIGLLLGAALLVDILFPGLLRGRLPAPARASVLGLSLALGIFASVAFLSCVLDIGEPRQRSFVDPLGWWACLLAADLWRRARQWQNVQRDYARGILSRFSVAEADNGATRAVS